MTSDYTAQPGQSIYNIVYPSQSFKVDNFIPSTYCEELVKTGERIGPFYQLSSDPSFPVCSARDSERGHYCGFRRPLSPSEGKRSWGIGDPWGNTASYCREFYLLSFEKELAIFKGIPRYLDPETGRYVDGTELVANLNNVLASAIQETNKWKWDPAAYEWVSISDASPPKKL